jgi:flagellin-like protein
MELDRRAGGRRRGVAGIVAAVLMFAMLFTVGAGYFLFVNQGERLYSSALFNRAANVEGAISESATVSAQLVKGSLGVVVANEGGVPINVTGAFVTDSEGGTTFIGPGSSRGLPMVVDPGATSPVIDTGVTYQSALTYTIKVFTARGNLFTATFPLSTQQQAVQLSGVTQGLGSVFMIFSSFRFYSVDNNPRTVGDGWEVGGFYGFNVPNGVDSLFQGAFENLDPLQRNITINEQTSLYQEAACLGGPGCGGNAAVYFIVGDLTNYPHCGGGDGHPPCVGAEAFRSVTIPYGKTMLLNFSAPVPGVCVGPGGPGPGGPGNECQNAQNSINGVAPIFLELFGEFSDHTPFGQTIPFVASYGSGATFGNGLDNYPYLQLTRGQQMALSLNGFTSAPTAYWTWANGTLADATYGTPTLGSVTFVVPTTATVGAYYSVMVTDGNETAYAEVQVTG